MTGWLFFFFEERIPLDVLLPEVFLLPQETADEVRRGRSKQLHPCLPPSSCTPQIFPANARITLLG